MPLLDLITGNRFFTSCLCAALLALVWKYACPRAKLSWPIVIFPLVWPLLSQVLLGLSAVNLPITIDRYLYIADGGFGFQPAFAGTRLIFRNPWLWHSSEFCYANLPLALGIQYLVLRTWRDQRESVLFGKFVVMLGAVGFALYFLMPAVGPGGAFAGDFPYRTPVVTAAPTAMPLIQRNCMPSLHTAWILCMLLCAGPIAHWLRGLLWAFAAATLLYTLSGGGHYLVDMIVAIPFTIAVKYLVESEWKSIGFFSNAALVALWFVLLRYAAGIVSMPVVIYPITAATFALAFATRPGRSLTAANILPAVGQAILPEASS